MWANRPSAWNCTTQYAAGHIVTHRGIAYIALTAVVANREPRANPTQWQPITNAWHFVVADNNTRTYSLGDTVNISGNIFVCAPSSTGTVSDTIASIPRSSDWYLLNATGSSGGSGGGITRVASGDTLTGDGTVGSLLNVANPFTAADETKLDGIETGATADQTGSEIVTLLTGLSGNDRLPASAVRDISSSTSKSSSNQGSLT